MSGKTHTRAKGSRGEDIAVKHLKKNGYKIIERNWRHHSGEIDVIAKDGKTLVFIEVKMRNTTTHGAPSEAVTDQKMRKISMAAGFYIASHYGKEIPMRFDIVEVYPLNDQNNTGFKKFLSAITSKKHRVQIIRNVIC